MYKTGETAPFSGYYRFTGHIGGCLGCHPTWEEMEIPLSKGETFPPIRSCGKGAYWDYSRSF